VVEGLGVRAVNICIQQRRKLNAVNSIQPSENRRLFILPILNLD
jgi:hypothetical protein